MFNCVIWTLVRKCAKPHNENSIQGIFKISQQNSVGLGELIYISHVKWRPIKGFIRRKSNFFHSYRLIYVAFALIADQTTQIFGFQHNNKIVKCILHSGPDWLDNSGNHMAFF
jgi:coproporphyrinogen III oxidase